MATSPTTIGCTHAQSGLGAILERRAGRPVPAECRYGPSRHVGIEPGRRRSRDRAGALQRHSAALRGQTAPAERRSCDRSRCIRASAGPDHGRLRGGHRRRRPSSCRGTSSTGGIRPIGSVRAIASTASRPALTSHTISTDRSRWLMARFPRSEPFGQVHAAHPSPQPVADSRL